MGVYTALFAAGFRRQSTYRGALVAGVTANVFFGVFRSAAFVALYRQRSQAGGLDLSDALTYVWVIQTQFGVVFTPWMWEWPEAVRSGAFVTELLRPGDVFGRRLALDLGRASFMHLVRGMPMLLIPGLFYDLRLPTTVVGWAATAVTFLLAIVAAFELRFLVGAVSFWSPDFRGWWSVSFGFVWLFAGVVVPVEMFPGLLRLFGQYGPLSAIFVAPVRVIGGRDVLVTLLAQLLWAAVIGVACRRLMGRAERMMVISGG